MEEQKSTTSNWMDDITPKTSTLKVLDGEKAVFIFQDNGVKKEHADYGKSVAFLTKVIEMTKLVEGNPIVISKIEEPDKTFYVKSNNFDLLGQIKELSKANKDSLIGLKVELSRKGKLKSDTRYIIKKI
jgi:hypothetical protein